MRYLFALLLLTGVAFAQSQQPSPRSGERESSPPQTQPQRTEQPTATDQRGTDQSPFFVKVLPAQKTEAEAAQEANDRKEKSSTDGWLVWWTGAVALFTLILGAIAGWQGWQLKRSVDILAQAERAVLHIIVENNNFQFAMRGAISWPNSPGMDDGTVSTRPFVQFRIKNYGKTPAIIKEISRLLIHRQALEETPAYFPVDEILKEQMLSANGTTDELQCNLQGELLKLGETKSILHGHSAIWFWGRILYDDIFGNEHEHRFIWRYHGGSHGFRPYYENPEYNKNT